MRKDGWFHATTKAATGIQAPDQTSHFQASRLKKRKGTKTSYAL
jgi:hypothetical protein